MIVVDTSGILASRYLAERLGHRAADELLDDVAAEAYEPVDFDAGDVRSAKEIIGDATHS